MILSCSSICKSFGSDDILKNASFHIEEHEKAAIVGINGAGKSTLLKIITGELPADSGEVVISKGKTLGYLAQNQDLLSHRTIYDEMLEVKRPVIEMEERLRELEVSMKLAEGEELEAMMDTYSRLSHQFDLINGYAWKSEIVGVLKGLGFPEEEFGKQISTLSGGQKTRVSLGKLLLTSPDIILLDEPTNHLDITSKEILENALSHYGGTVLYVSHDRYFINKTATRILDLTGGKLLNYIGNYDYYLEKREDMMAAHFGTSSDGIAKTPAAGGSVFSGSVLRTAGAADSGQASVSVQSVSPNSPATDTKLDWKAQKEEQARLRKRQNDLKKVEAEIHDLETRDGEIDALLCDESVFTDVARLMELNKEKEDLAAKLEVLYEKWEELAE